MAPFDGDTYEPDRDRARLQKQLGRVRGVMADGRWHTLQGIADITDDPVSSVSARLRDLRKVKFGGHEISRQYCGGGLWEYRMKAEPEQLDLLPRA